ncbi:PAP2 superfamily protein [compost metagenome]
MFALPVLGLMLLPLALLVAVSRMYLGLHYPSDCAAGAFIGTVSAILTGFLI